ncbi:MAG: UPF0147 family protein [Candidatus Aenigmarchaeota archaeon]|nr:UPF0147 family protein [Candidatus Aenigmarchaeota archaeon]
MEKSGVIALIEGLIEDRGVPQRIKSTLEESLEMLNSGSSPNEKISHIISVLDDASSNPNLSMGARTHIWNIVSSLEGEMAKK